MADTRTIEIEVLRYNPEQDAAPHFQSFQVPFTDDTSVLQGLLYIKDHLDGSLTFRWSCRMAICGSCGKMVNGRPELSCHTFLRDYYPGPLRIEPLNHFPIVRDLVIDQSDFLKKLESIKPYNPQVSGACLCGSRRVPSMRGRLGDWTLANRANALPPALDDIAAVGCRDRVLRVLTRIIKPRYCEHSIVIGG